MINMKKIIKYIVFVFIILFSINVNALSAPYFVEQWIDGKAYYKDELLTDQWAYDPSIKKYVLLDENGNKVREVTNLQNDPQVKKGKINISANVPENLKDINIKIEISSEIYFYTLELNKDNNFKVEKDINTDVYYVDYSVEGADGLENQLPNQFKIYEGETTSYKIDYSKYGKTVKKEEKAKKIIVYIAIGGIVLALVVVLLMFLKARSI